jgi:hypothetical protein
MFKFKGFTDKELRDAENMVKGRIAETIVEQLFSFSGYDVFRFGMENTVPAITGLLNRNNSPVAKIIRNMPDFVIKKGNDVFFIEVKFRADGNFSIDDLKSGYSYDDAYIVLVSTRHIKCISVKELKSGRSIISGDRYYLGYRKEFGLDPDSVVSFCEFAVKFFVNV